MRRMPKVLRWWSGLFVVGAIWYLAYAAHHVYISQQYSDPIGSLVVELRTQALWEVILTLACLIAAFVPVLAWLMVSWDADPATSDADPGAGTTVPSPSGTR